MKKISLYILILVSLTGIFSPVLSVHAKDVPNETPTQYQLLEKLPCPPNTPDCTNGKLESITIDEKALGKYINLIISLVIGISAVLAVVMIVMGGIEYMGSELISSKESGIERIQNAILGLLIALGAYALLNTINPDLLKSDINIPEAKVTIMLERENLSDAVSGDSGTPPGATSLCSVGITKTSQGMFACASIATNVDNMLKAASQAGLNISGGGYRSLAQQKALRIKNCNGDTTNANANCNPPTALPGRSHHNHGMAFDLKCSGSFIQHSSNACFIWLKANASKYGLSNLSGEPWHWSIDGR